MREVAPVASEMRKIVHIDEDKCDGCGLCVPSCHEGAIQIIDGKAKLVAENLCDGLGDCLGHCPQDAITIDERPAEPFDEEAVKAHLAEMETAFEAPAGCPGARAMTFDGGNTREPEEAPAGGDAPSRLGQWPVQLALVPPTAPYFQEADLLLAADCAPFAFPGFHEKLLKGRALAIACPKLDDIEPYIDKLAQILRQNEIRSLGVAHMEVPCCLGLVRVAQEAMKRAGKTVPFWTMKLGIRGDVIQE